MSKRVEQAQCSCVGAGTVGGKWREEVLGGGRGGGSVGGCVVV